MKLHQSILTRIPTRDETDYVEVNGVWMISSLVRRKNNEQEVVGVRCITNLEEALSLLDGMEGKSKF